MPASGSSSQPSFQHTMKRCRDIEPHCIAQSYANNSAKGLQKEPTQKEPSICVGPSLYTRCSRHIRAVLPLSPTDCSATAIHKHPQHLQQDMDTVSKHDGVTNNENLHTAPPFALNSRTAIRCVQGCELLQETALLTIKRGMSLQPAACA
jgi:hypothetical protein